MSDAPREESLAQWLFRRFDQEHIGPVSKEYAESWDALTSEDKAFWEHEAAAVRRAVEGSTQVSQATSVSDAGSSDERARR